MGMWLVHARWLCLLGVGGGDFGANIHDKQLATSVIPLAQAWKKGTIQCGSQRETEGLNEGAWWRWEWVRAEKRTWVGGKFALWTWCVQVHASEQGSRGGESIPAPGATFNWVPAG